jgi:hypothetical protein
LKPLSERSYLARLKPCPDERLERIHHLRIVLSDAKTADPGIPARRSREPALRKGLWVNPLGIHETGPGLRKANPIADLDGEHRAPERSFSGRSKQRPYEAQEIVGGLRGAGEGEKSRPFAKDSG